MINSVIFFIFSFAVIFIYASDYDGSLVDTLKIEANHNIERLKSYKKEKINNKIFENEREKGLGEFFEEQEKWDLIRERGKQEYLKQKLSEMRGNSREEYMQNLKEKEAERLQYEKNRSVYVKTRDKVRSQQIKTISQLESEEMELYVIRPRYEFDKRRKNKWVAISGSKSSAGSGVPGYQGTAPSPGLSGEFPPNPPEFPAAPAPYEGFEELAPPPPLYDSSVPYDPSFGGDMSIPPPPPPPPDYDF